MNDLDTPPAPTKPVKSSAYYDKTFQITVPGIVFFIIHLAVLTVFLVPFTWWCIPLALGLFFLRMFTITGGYHRYFSHRTYKTSRFFQFLLAFIGGTSAQKGALWWAAYHRHHHKHSDTDEDVHSAMLEGFYWSHVGWILSKEFADYDRTLVRDWNRYPELVWLDKNHMVPPVLLALACYGFGGTTGLVWGFIVSTVALYHSTFAINSLCHMFGSRRYETTDASKNSLWLAIVTMGEGWHNNHHHYPYCARQGFFWWEWDPTYYGLKVLSWCRVIWDIKEPPTKVVIPTNAPAS